MSALPPNHDAIPAELREGRIWACGRGRGKDKEPFIAGRNRHASSTDASTWVSFDEALAAYQRGGYDALWRATRRADRVVGIDLDACRDSRSGVLAPWATVYVRLLNSYTEISPSGEGLRIFVKGELPEGDRKRGHVEVYDDKRFLSVTGNRLDGAPATVEKREAELGAFHRLAFWKEPPKASRNGHGPSEAAGLDDDALLARMLGSASCGGKARALNAGDTSGYPSQSEAELAFCNYARFFGGDREQVRRLLLGSGLSRDKHDREDYLARTLDKAMEGEVIGRPDARPELEPETAGCAEPRAAYEQLRQERDDLKAVLVQQARIFANPALTAGQKLASIAVLNEMWSAESRAPDEWHAVYRQPTARKVGVSEKVVGQAIGILAETRAVEKRTEHELVRVDRETGEILEQPRPRYVTKLRPLVSRPETWRAAATASPPKPPPRPPKAVPCCSEHPDAGTDIKRACRACGRIVGGRAPYSPSADVGFDPAPALCGGSGRDKYGNHNTGVDDPLCGRKHRIGGDGHPNGNGHLKPEDRIWWARAPEQAP